MDLQQVITDNPAWLVMAVLMAVAIIAWVSYLVQELIAGDVDALVGVCGSCSVLLIGAASITPAFYHYMPEMLILAYASFLVVPLGKRMVDQKEQRTIEVEKIEKAYQAIGMRPDSPALKFRLAAMLYEEGMSDVAVAIGDSVIGRMPQRVFLEEHRHLQVWKSRAVSEPAKSFACAKCGSRNKASDVFCQKCGSPIYLLAIKGGAESGNLNTKFISIWLTLVILGIAVPAAFLTLPMVAAIGIMAVLVILCGFILNRAFASQGEVTD